MSPKTGNHYPNPAAEHPLSERLERVRETFGFRSKRAFWQKLCDGWDAAVSYEAVRNYHYDREAPPSYLARVLRVFPDLRSEWLLLGEGEMRHSQEEVAGISRDAIESASDDPEWRKAVRFKYEVLTGVGLPAPDLSGTPVETDEEGYVREGDRAKGLLAWARSVNAGRIPPWVPSLAEARRRLDVDASTLGKALGGPLEALALEPDEMTDDNLTSYMLSMVPVLIGLAPAVQNANPEEED